MKSSQRLKQMIMKFEGFCPNAVKCPAGVWTYGFGHTAGVKQGMSITRPEAEALLEKEIEEFEVLIRPLLAGVALNQNQYDAIVSFAYNVGVGALKSSTLLRKVKANPVDPLIRNEFLKWVYAAGKKLQGLVNRRTAEANLYFE